MTSWHFLSTKEQTHSVVGIHHITQTLCPQTDFISGDMEYWSEMRVLLMIKEEMASQIHSSKMFSLPCVRMCTFSEGTPIPSPKFKGQ